MCQGMGGGGVWCCVDLWCVVVCWLQTVTDVYERVFPAEEEGAKDVEDNCETHTHNETCVTKINESNVIL